MMKATIYELLQRADGWCKSVKGQILPLLELLAMSQRLVPFIILFEWPINIIGNLGGNADPSVPYLWDGRFFCDSAKPAKQSYKYVLK